MDSSAKGRTVLEVGADGVALITIINPPVNSLSFDVLYSLKDSYEEALRRNDVKAIVVTGAKGKFSVALTLVLLAESKGEKARSQSLVLYPLRSLLTLLKLLGNLQLLPLMALHLGEDWRLQWHAMLEYQLLLHN